MTVRSFSLFPVLTPVQNRFCMMAAVFRHSLDFLRAVTEFAHRTSSTPTTPVLKCWPLSSGTLELPLPTAIRAVARTNRPRRLGVCRGPAQPVRSL